MNGMVLMSNNDWENLVCYWVLEYLNYCYKLSIKAPSNPNRFYKS